MAVPGVEPVLFANVPPATPSDHTADVAPPPNEPPSAGVVAPWHIADNAPPALNAGFGLTVTLINISAPGHPPGEVGLISYCTTAGTAPVLTSTSFITFPHNPLQSLNPVAVPLIKAVDHVKSVDPMVDASVMARVEPLQ